MDKKLLVRIILTAWIVIWVVFLIRPFFKKDLMKGYSALLKLSTEGKRAYVTGPRLYDFIGFCNQNMKRPSTYKMIGVDEYSLEHRRARYYLYPNIEKDDPEFILIYGRKDFGKEGYKMFKILDLDRHILRRVK